MIQERPITVTPDDSLATAAAAPAAAPGIVPVNPAMAPALVAKAKPTLARFAPRMGLLVEGCRRAGVVVDGAPVAARPPVLSPKGEQVVTHVQAQLGPNGALAQLVPVLVGRFYAAVKRVEQLEQALTAGATLEPALLDEGRRAVIFLTRFPEQVRHDPVLSDLFPLPPTTNQTAPLPMREAVAPAPAADGDLLAKARAVAAYMTPRAEQIRLVLGMLDPLNPLKMAEMMSEAGTRARPIAQRLRRYPRELAQLQEASLQYINLKRQLDTRARELTSDELHKLLDPLVEQLERFHRTMELGEIFPTNQMPRFAA